MMATSSQHTSPLLNGDNSHSPAYLSRNGIPDRMPLPPRTPNRNAQPQSPPLSDTPSPEPDTASFIFSSPQRRTKSMPTPSIHELNCPEPSGPTPRAHARIRSYADDVRVQHFPRIARPVELMRNSYDCVVIGSGYGGGVAASRMARAGQSVCLLELGKERWPGEYPTDFKEAFSELHCSGQFVPSIFGGVNVNSGDATGMYHLIFGKGQHAVVCNGLGGTSLINANVFLRADANTMAMKIWPEELRQKGALDKYYDMVEKVLEPETYPEDWPELPKLELLKKQAQILGLEDKFRRVPQTTRFKNGPNSCGVEMSASGLTGQDVTGVNDGSKTTTLVTYLADAWNWGAEMFCECEVRYIDECKDSRGGYIIYFAWHGRNRGHFKANLHGDLMWVHAKEAVFLGAGALGTTEILLRSKAMGLSTSDQVGKNMSGNGDILAFGYNTDHQTNCVGRPFPQAANPVGPTITGVIDNRSGHENPLDGYVIQEGALPSALSRFFHTMMDLLPEGEGPSNDTIIDKTQAALARWGSRLFGPYFKQGAVEKTQIYLIMSHDSNQACLSLQNDKPVLEFLGVGRSDHVKFLNSVLTKATQAVGGTLIGNPFFSLMKQQVTVHPIGGACMARDGSGMTGVTDHTGRVFRGNGEDVFPGLIVTDGAVVPAALGVNPFATITALAERTVEHYAEERGLVIRQEKNGILDLFAEPAHSYDWSRACKSRSRAQTIVKKEVESIRGIHKVIEKSQLSREAGFGFTEAMSGFLHNDPNMKEDQIDTYNLAYRTAKSLCESARFFLSVQSFNTRTIVNDPDHRALLTGTFVCPTIPGSPFMVQRGDFGLFILDHKAPGTRNLTYDFDMKGIDGEVRHFHGYKVVDSSVALAPLHFWRSTSTLYVTITKKLDVLIEPDCEPWRQGEVIAKGIMHIQPVDLVSEIMTMTPTGTDLFKKVKSASKFLTYFMRKSLNLFLAPMAKLQYPSQTYHSYINPTEFDAQWTVTARDKVRTKLFMWEPTHLPKHDDGTDMEPKNLFMVPGAAVDHQIFALPTIPFNAVNYFTRAGYRVFITVHRIGQLQIAENAWTTFDARLDIRAALEKIREAYPDAGKIYTVAHCMGSVALAAGLLEGAIPADWLLGVTCSQVFLNPIWNTTQMIKALAGPIPLDKLYTFIAGSWFSCSTSTDDTRFQRLVNQVLRFMPDARREICNSAACHRTTLVFGRCWNHRNLNEATHRQIDRFFGGVNMTLLHLLMHQGVNAVVTSNAPLREVLTTPRNIQRLKGLPVFLFVGADNAVLHPNSTEKSYEVLCDTFGSISGDGAEGVAYRRQVVPGYGHLDCWMGRNAWKDVFPMVRQEVDRWTRGESYRFREPEDRFSRMMVNGDLLY